MLEWATHGGLQRPPMNERDLVLRSQRGDLDAFNQLVAAYQGQVYSLAFRMLGEGASAEDVAQETFISTFRHIRSFRGENLRGWLLRIATNACYDHLRAGQRSRSDSLEAIQERDPTWQPASTQESPEEHAVRVELSETLNSVFALLPADQRAVLVLSDVEGLSYEEIAEATGVSLGTVKSRLSRARARVREHLTAHRELLPARYRQTL